MGLVEITAKINVRCNVVLNLQSVPLHLRRAVIHLVEPSYKVLLEYNLLLTQRLTSYPLVLIGLN
jgi:hypothetical protein